MDVIVQKYGGTSVSDKERRRRVIEHIRRERESGYALVVVVSAMGRYGDPYATDTLLSLIGGAHSNLPPREKDLLLSTGEIISAAVLAEELWEVGIPNTILTGGQAGIITNDRPNNAHIIALKPERVKEALVLGHVVIVPGFQGMSQSGQITTLGRGGSDTSAAALGVALEAKYVDIYTDVNGVMTADPRFVEEARPIREMTYTEVANYAYLGAKVIHPRAVELAMQKNIPLRIRGLFDDDIGTVILPLSEINKQRGFKERLITGITHVTDVTQIVVTSDRVDYELHLKVFKAMATRGISVDFINASPSHVAYTVSQFDAEEAEKLLQQMGLTYKLTPGCAKVSVVGAGMTGRPGVMSTIVEALIESGIPILQAADSHTTIWVLIEKVHLKQALLALHRKFALAIEENAGEDGEVAQFMSS